MRTEPKRKDKPAIWTEKKRIAGWAAVLLVGSGWVLSGVSQASLLDAKPVGQNATTPAAATPANAVPALTPVLPTDPKERQIAMESAQLLKLAMELKAEVGKSTKDTLSVVVIRKADAIAHVAHGMKEQMRVDAAAN